MHCQDPTGLPPLIAHELRHYARLAPDKVRGKCHMVCHEIARWFSELTVVVGAAEWSGTPVVHYWLEYDDRVIDPTRQQFGAGGVTLWKAKKQDMALAGFSIQVGDYMAEHPEAKKAEILTALADVAYRDDGLLPSHVWYHLCRQEFGSGLCASIGVYLDAGKTCETCGATDADNTFKADSSAVVECR